MFIINIIPAPQPKKAVSYDPIEDDLVIQTADVIGLIEVQNPENPQEVANMPMYMVSDEFGIYNAPQVDPHFLEFIELGDALDLDKYKAQIEGIKKFHEEIENETVEVESKGNVSHIKRFVRPAKKKEDPK